MTSLSIVSDDRRARVTLTLVSAPDPSIPSDWCLAVDIANPDFSGRNADVYFLAEEAAAFVTQLRGLEATRAGRADLRSIGEGSDAQEFTLGLVAHGPTTPIAASAEVVKVRVVPGGYNLDRCRLSFSIDQGDLPQLLRAAQALFQTAAR